MMEAIPFTRASGLLPVVGFLARAGAPVEKVLHHCGLSTRLLEDPDAPLPIHLVSRFYREAADCLGSPDLGAQVGRSTQIWSMGTFAEVLRPCRTVKDVIETSVTLVRQYTTGNREWVEEEAERIWYCSGIVEGATTGRRQVEAFLYGLMLNTVRCATGSSWLPPEVRLPDHGTKWLESLELGHSVKIIPGQNHVAMAIPRRLLPSPFPTLASVSHGDTAYSKIPEDFDESIRLIIRTLMTHACPPVELVAEAAGLSVRTLQRRLGAHGLTYSKLLDQTRMEMASELLSNTDTRAIDVAFDLDYSDPANFSRAFRRWSGISPRDFRREHAAPG